MLDICLGGGGGTAGRICVSIVAGTCCTFVGGRVDGNCVICACCGVVG